MTDTATIDPTTPTTPTTPTEPVEGLPSAEEPEPVAPVVEGIVEREERRAAEAIAGALGELGFGERPLGLRPVPFAGTWGVASSVCLGLANDVVMAELAAAGELEGLSKKEAKRRAAETAPARAQALADQVAAAVRTGSPDAFSRVEAVNGYVNVYVEANVVAARLIGEVVGHGAAYGQGAPRAERVMVEHSQPNTHKAFHVGHLRNSCLGVSLGRILRAAGYPVQDATYIGDIGRHVIRCLWCYERFHLGEEPAEPAARGRWLGELYVEAETRLAFRQDALDLLLLLSKEDVDFVAGIDRLLKYLWRKNTDGLDIAYLLGRITHGQEIKEELLHEEETIPKFWPLVGDHLREAALNPTPYVPVEGEPEPTTTPGERLARWEALAARMDDWWPAVPAWREEVSQTFQRWERKDPPFVALWEETRAWSMADFERIFAELGASFDVWFFESEVEEEGRRIVAELLERGIAEVSDGLPVVKIDEKLGLETPTYRTMPILRSDGTTLYSTKDLALTRQKFERYGVDRALWVVDVRQSLYFQQIVKILELFGFSQAAQTHHVGYEFVKLPEGIISSRKGNAPAYDDVREAVLARARQVIAEKNPEMPDDERERVARDVGIGSLKYAMLARDNNKVVVFDLDEALSFEGHAAPYIQYAHARACRILEHGEATDEAIVAGLAGLDFGELRPEELGLLQGIAALPEEIQRAAAEERPLLIANYVYDLAKRFNDFYHACQVLHAEEPTRTARLALTAAARQTLANGLGLLGIAAPRAM